MFRATLIAYLSLATAVSSSLCCCNVRHLYAKQATASCCKSKAPREASCPHCRTTEAEHKEKSIAKSPCEGNGQCGCGVRQAKLSSPTTLVTHHTYESLDIDPSYTQMDYESPALDVVAARFQEKQTPASLYGRDLLRAYQILRC